MHRSSIHTSPQALVERLRDTFTSDHKGNTHLEYLRALTELA
jgi:hypothetical protein